MELGRYGNCVWALLIGEVLLRPGDVQMFRRKVVSIRRMWLSRAGQRKCILFVVITMCCVWWVYVCAHCVQAVVQRESLLLREIYKIYLNESGIPTPHFNYRGSYRGTLMIMILAWPWLWINLIIIKLIKCLGNDDNMSIMEEQFDMTTLHSFFPFWKISWSVMLMTPLWWLLCHPQASELQ